MCVHIAAGLYKIRQFLDQKTEERKARAEDKQAGRVGRLSVQNVLETASEADLAAFVRSYARNDREFALALKTWFASQIEGAENPFQLVFETALPRHAGIRALKDAELRRLRKTLNNLGTQTTAALEESNGLTVFQITTAILQNTLPVLSKLEGSKRSQLVEYCRTACKQLLDLSPDILSPELRENRRDILFKLLTGSNFPGELEDLLVPFISAAATNDTYFERIRQFFDRTAFPAPQFVLNLFLAALASRQLPKAVVRVVQDYTQRPGQVKKALLFLDQLHYPDAVSLAGEYFLEKGYFSTGQAREVESLIIQAAENAGNRTRYKALLRRLFQRNGSEEIYLRLKSLSGPNWPKERAALLGKFHAAGELNRLAPLLAADGDLETLTTVLNQQGSLAAVQQYETVLLPEQTAFVRNYYIRVLSEYLNEHFGRQAAEKVRTELAGLLRLNQSELVKEIILTLVARFPDRQSLPEELAELFQNSKRPFAFPPASQTNS
jgi:hypothetical protein